MTKSHRSVIYHADNKKYLFKGHFFSAMKTKHRIINVLIYYKYGLFFVNIQLLSNENAMISLYNSVSENLFKHFISHNVLYLAMQIFCL